MQGRDAEREQSAPVWPATPRRVRAGPASADSSSTGPQKRPGSTLARTILTRAKNQSNTTTR
eukprot:5682621-Pyramimonas_sp.AAC.1